jgi:hypothetical protein
MKAKPLREISEAELSKLSVEQRTILDKSLESGVVRSIDSESPLLGSLGAGGLDILALSAAEIQRKHISRIVMQRRAGLAELNSLLEREKAKPSPREDVITVIKYGIERIHQEDPDTLEDKFYREIEVIEDVIEPEVPVEAPKKTRTRMNKLAMETN